MYKPIISFIVETINQLNKAVKKIQEEINQHKVSLE